VLRWLLDGVKNFNKGKKDAEKNAELLVVICSILL
jgi:hypothetical protein